MPVLLDREPTLNCLPALSVLTTALCRGAPSQLWAANRHIFVWEPRETLSSKQGGFITRCSGY